MPSYYECRFLRDALLLLPLLLLCAREASPTAGRTYREIILTDRTLSYLASR